MPDLRAEVCASATAATQANRSCNPGGSGSRSWRTRNAPLPLRGRSRALAAAYMGAAVLQRVASPDPVTSTPRIDVAGAHALSAPRRMSRGAGCPFGAWAGSATCLGRDCVPQSRRSFSPASATGAADLAAFTARPRRSDRCRQPVWVTTPYTLLRLSDPPGASPGHLRRPIRKNLRKPTRALDRQKHGF